MNWPFIVALICVSLMTNDVGPFFMYSLVMNRSPLEKHTFKSFVHLKIMLLLFSYLSYKYLFLFVFYKVNLRGKITDTCESCSGMEWTGNGKVGERNVIAFCLVPMGREKAPLHVARLQMGLGRGVGT